MEHESVVPISGSTGRVLEIVPLYPLFPGVLLVIGACFSSPWTACEAIGWKAMKPLTPSSLLVSVQQRDVNGQ